ncbi:MAG: hypothetical protein ABIR94_11005, partial [Rubrivivax sp.]
MLRPLSLPAGRGRRADAMSRAGVLLAVVFMAVLTAIALGSGQFLLAGMLMAVIVVPMAYAIYLYTFGPRHDMLFWLLAVSVFATSLASALLRQRFSSISTGLILAFAPMVVIAILQQARSSKRLMPAILLTLAFYLVAVLSSLLGRSGVLSSVYSGIVSLKPFVLLGFGAALFWSARSERAFASIVRWAWLPLLALAALQWFAPSIYAAMLSDPESQPEGNPIVPGFPRAMGPFNHPAILAGIAGCFGLFCFVNFLLQERGRFVSAVTLVLYLVVMAMAGQRQELAGALITLVAAYAIARWRPPFSLLVGVTTLALLLVAIGLYAVIPATIEN